MVHIVSVGSALLVAVVVGCRRMVYFFWFRVVTGSRNRCNVAVVSSFELDASFDPDVMHFDRDDRSGRVGRSSKIDRIDGISGIDVDIDRVAVDGAVVDVASG